MLELFDEDRVCTIPVVAGFTQVIQSQGGLAGCHFIPKDVVCQYC